MNGRKFLAMILFLVISVSVASAFGGGALLGKALVEKIFKKFMVTSFTIEKIKDMGSLQGTAVLKKAHSLAQADVAAKYDKKLGYLRSEMMKLNVRYDARNYQEYEKQKEKERKKLQEAIDKLEREKADRLSYLDRVLDENLRYFNQYWFDPSRKIETY